MRPQLLAALLTVALETPCVAWRYPGQRLRLGLACALGTAATNLAMNVLLPRWLGTGAAWLLVGEGGALLLEGVLYTAVARPRDPVRAFTASALANGVSFGAGLLLWG
jgi:hypothetical protein